MFRLLGIIFGLPWPVLVLLAGGLFWFGHHSKQQAIAFEAEKAQALVEGQPDAVPLDAFDEDDVHLADEVHVTTWVNTAHNYELTYQKRGTDTVRRMFVLFGPGDGVDSKVARGVIVIPPESVDAFLALMLSNVVGEVDGNLLFNLNGQRESSPDLWSMVNDALEDQGLHKAADFLVVEPYFNGRDEALKPRPDIASNMMNLFGGLGLVLLVFALRNFAKGRKQAELRTSLADVEIPPVGTPINHYGAKPMQVGVAPVAPAPPPPSSEGWSPLEAVRARQQAQFQAQLDKEAMLAGRSRDAETGTARGGLSLFGSGGRKIGTVQKLAGAFALYMVIYLAFGQFTGPSSMNTVSEDGIVAAVMESVFGLKPDETAQAAAGMGTDESGPVPGTAEAVPVVTTDIAPAPVVVEVVPAPAAPVVQDAAGAAPEAGPVWVEFLPAVPPSVALSAMAGAGLLIVALALGLMLMRRRPQGRVSAGRAHDPWDRLDQRLR
jgi:hypothetical protein